MKDKTSPREPRRVALEATDGDKTFSVGNEPIKCGVRVGKRRLLSIQPAESPHSAIKDGRLDCLAGEAELHLSPGCRRITAWQEPSPDRIGKATFDRVFWHGLEGAFEGHK